MNHDNSDTQHNDTDGRSSSRGSTDRALTTMANGRMHRNVLQVRTNLRAGGTVAATLAAKSFPKGGLGIDM